MRHFTLVREQRLPGTPDEVFPFFADAGNLEAITPPFLSFRIVTPRPIPMCEGTLIEYRLKLHGIPVRWRTRIDAWEPGVRFVDRQLSGPYRLWHHTHEFEALPEGGTLMRDIVRYRLPFGVAGAVAHLLFVRRDLRTIFDYRAQRVAALLAASMPSRTSSGPGDVPGCSPSQDQATVPSGPTTTSARFETPVGDQ